ncbi:MAG: ABC transporter ATP-binding protein [Vibrio sp.]
MSTSVILAQSLSKSVSTHQQHLTILNQVNLSIEAGESVAIVGASGAGKSTLMTLLAGLDTPTDGEIYLLGQPLSQLDDEARAALRRESIGFVFQSLLQAVGLAERMHHVPAQLSGGEQQRVALARAFMTRPQLLFADEPTGNLDQATAAKVIDLLFELNRDHATTLVLITHDLQLAQRCQRRFFMHTGELEERV